MNSYFVYIMTNNSKTLYVGVTNNLERRVFDHKNRLIEGFTKKYSITKLVYFEETSDIINPSWKDLAVVDPSRSLPSSLLDSSLCSE